MRVSISKARKDRQDAAASPRAPSRRTRSGLIERVVVWGSQCWPFGPDLALVVPEQEPPGLKVQVAGCPDVIACPDACCNGELSQQPMWPHCAQRHRWYHQPVPCPASHSTHPAPLGSASGSTPCTVIAAALARR